VELHFEVIWANLDMFLRGAGVTFGVATVAMFGGSLLGIGGAMFRRSNLKVLRFLGTVYVNLFRNTPLLVQAYILYFGLTFIINLDSLSAALVSLTINNGGYMTEIVRAGMEGIHRNEIEASYALGMSHVQALRYILIPHALRIVYLPTVNQFLLLVLGSSVLALIGLPELTFQARKIEAYTFRAFEVYITSMIAYVLLAALSTILLRAIGWRFYRGRKGILGRRR